MKDQDIDLDIGSINNNHNQDFVNEITINNDTINSDKQNEILKNKDLDSLLNNMISSNVKLPEHRGFSEESIQ